MSDGDSLEILFGEAGKKTIVVPAKYRYLYLRAVIARDQLGLDVNLEPTPEELQRRVLKRPYDPNGPSKLMEYIVSWDALLWWHDNLALYRDMLRPEIVFSDLIPPDVVIFSENPPPPQNVIPWKGTWDTIYDRLPRYERKDGPKPPPPTGATPPDVRPI
jgi:hypothetical protein